LKRYKINHKSKSREEKAKNYLEEHYIYNRLLDYKDDVEFWMKNKPIDWLPDSERMILAFYPNISKEDLFDAMDLMIIKLHTVKGVGFPQCVENYPNCPKKKVLNYLNTTVRSAVVAVYNNKKKNRSKYIEDFEWEQFHIDFPYEEAWVNMIKSECTPLEEQMLFECLSNPLTWENDKRFSKTAREAFKEKIKPFLSIDNND
jgi:uncharacterized protein (DUF433 family)